MRRGTILVTGSTGVIGRALVSKMDNVYSLVTASRTRSGGDHRLVDLSKPGSFTRLLEEVQPDVVVHASGGPRRQIRELWDINLFASIELLEIARQRQDIRVIVFGSAAEYRVNARHKLRESDALEPATEYGRAKMIQTFAARRAVACGAQVLVLRPFNVVAPDLPPGTALGDLRRQLLESSGRLRRIRCGSLNLVRDYVSAEFVASVILACLERWPSDPVLNVCSGVGHRLEDVFRAVGQLLDVELDLVVDGTLSNTVPSIPASIGDPATLAGATGLRYTSSIDTVARTLMKHQLA